MSCACGHHHDHAPRRIEGGTEIALNAPLIALEGRLICQDATQMMTALSLLPEHVALSRAEPGNLRFELHQSEDPMVWALSELFADTQAFDAHRDRAARSIWGQQSAAIRRDFTRNEVLPRIRQEAKQDQAAITALLNRAFDGTSEGRLVDRLRMQGDLGLSLVADAAGMILGHVALSPITAERPALALAPVAVEPRVQGRGIGAALIRAAIDHYSDHLIVVLGDPDYYARFGFQPVNWDSPYAGPYLQALGPDLPSQMSIRHAPAFAAL